MRKILSFVILLLSISLCGYAQKEEVMAKLKENGFEADFLDTSLQDEDAIHYFDFKTTSNDGTTIKVSLGHFDPQLPVGERWQLVSVKGKSPSKKQIKKFNKAHNTKKDDINGKVDDNSWKVVSDTNDGLVISFKYEKESLPNKFAFLADCTGSATINKNTRRLEGAKFSNDGPLKIKIFNVTDLDMDVDYLYLEDEDAYVMKKERLDMKVKLFGEIVEIEEITEYSNYKKVK